MPFAGYGNETYLYALIHITIYIASRRALFIVVGIWGNHLRMLRVTTFIGRPPLHIFTDVGIPPCRMGKIPRIFEHIVTGTMDVHDRHPAIRAWLSSYRNPTNRPYRSYLICQLIHAQIGQPTAHGETRKVNTILVHTVLQLHILYDSFYKQDITGPGNIPHAAFALRVGHDKPFCICERIPLGLSLLIFGTLIHTMERNHQCRRFLHTLRHISERPAGSSPHHDRFPCLRPHL